jgi:hypothetical protein
VIGAEPAVEVVAADYDAHLLTLAESRQWSEGDPVSLPFVGAAPDIGAYEYGAGGDGGVGEPGGAGGVGGSGAADDGGVGATAGAPVGAGDEGEGGCGCRLLARQGGGPSAHGALWLLGALGVVRRRRAIGR